MTSSTQSTLTNRGVRSDPLHGWIRPHAAGRQVAPTPAVDSPRMAEPPADRIRKLLLRADNTLKNHVPGGDEAARVVRARAALEEARGLARDPSVPSPVRDLVERRLDGLSTLETSGDGPAAA